MRDYAVFPKDNPRRNDLRQSINTQKNTCMTQGFGLVQYSSVRNLHDPL